MAESLAELVRRKREELGLSQSALAKRIGAEGRTIANLERGRTRIVKMKFRPALAEVLGIPLARFNIAERGYVRLHRMTLSLPPDVLEELERRAGRKSIESVALDVLTSALFSKPRRTYKVGHVGGEVEVPR